MGLLSFSSSFEGGNLECVRVIDGVYYLFISPDINIKGHKQWFYFKVTAVIDITVSVVVHSFRKRESLYQKGQHPYGRRSGEGGLQAVHRKKCCLQDGSYQKKHGKKT